MKIKHASAVILLLCTQAQADPALQQRLEVLERKVRALSDVVLRLDDLQREVRQLRGEVEVQNHALESLKQRQRDLYLDLDNRLGGGGASGMAGPVPPPPATPQPDSTPSTAPARCRRAEPGSG